LLHRWDGAAAAFPYPSSASTIISIVIARLLLLLLPLIA
jgi:hypothetical protein